MKKYILAFLICVSLGAVGTVVLLTTSIPQSTESINPISEEYESISKDKYTFEETKDVNIENLEREYSISADELSSFTNVSEYVPGNSNPFTPKEDLQQSIDNNTDDNTNNNTDNGNGGVTNPPSVNK